VVRPVHLRWQYGSAAVRVTMDDSSLVTSSLLSWVDGEIRLDLEQTPTNLDPTKVNNL
jgi:hypothetical protein